MSAHVATLPALPARRLAEAFLTLVVALGLLAAAIGLSEAISRLVHGGVRPLLPVMYRHGAFPTLHPDAVMRMDVPGAAPVEYRTNALGARVADAAVGEGVPDVLVVGDSQALGWALPFEQSAGALVAAGRFGSARRAMLLASPATDPETALFNLRRARTGWTSDPASVVVYLNLGNDLDEAFSGRQTHHLERLGALSELLNRHSFAALDLHKLSLGATLRNQMGINSVLFNTSPAERALLADALVEAVRDSLAEFGPATRKFVVLIPNDYQVDLAEFDKYRPMYGDAALFERRRQQLPAMKAEMDAAQARVLAALRAAGVDVVDVAALAAGGSRRGTWFDRLSHHLNAAGNQAVADALLARLGAPAGGVR